MEKAPLHVHFMGICGSGCAAIALLAYEAGYRVSGCDKATDSYYAGALKQRGIQVFEGHDKAHLQDDVDIVAVSPALFDIDPENEELKEAEARGILMTWERFMGEYLQKGKRVIGISGTHGKTTTTFLTAEMLIRGGKDPSVLGGSVYREWGSGGRPGKSDLFLCEADEFNRNFHHYKAEFAVLNNVEMDHPECYKDLEEVLESFKTFLLGSPHLKTVLLNGDSEGAVEVLRRCAKCHEFQGVRVIVFLKDNERTFDDIFYPVEQIIYRINSRGTAGTTFSIVQNHGSVSFLMKLFGDYNVANAVCATLIARLNGVSDDVIEEVLATFRGVGRRFDPVGAFRGIPVYDDYAHHPTEIGAVLTMCRDYFPGKKVVAVFEPHQISRLRLMFAGYVDSLTIADRVIVARTHMGREIHKNIRPIAPEEWTAASDKIVYEEEPEEIAKLVLHYAECGECDIIVVIGAANSYKLSRFLCRRA